jgi:hypothetical protein
MKLAKTHLRCTIGDEFLQDCLVLILRGNLSSVSTHEIIEAYDVAVSRRANFKLIICNFILLRLVKHTIIYD